MRNGLVVDSNGTQNYFQNGQLHRLDGPAIVRADGTQLWCQNNKLHRFDGPAIIRADGTQLWFVKGKDITEDLSRYFNKDLSRESLTKSELLIFKLKWS